MTWHQVTLHVCCRVFALELCQASLEQLFQNDQLFPRPYNGPLPSDDQAFLQMATSLQYIHDQNLVHWDIKPENILISAQNGSRAQLKLTDIRYCKTTHKAKYSVNHEGGIKGTKYWLLPEFLTLLDHASQAISGRWAGCFSIGSAAEFIRLEIAVLSSIMQSVAILKVIQLLHRIIESWCATCMHCWTDLLMIHWTVLALATNRFGYR